jgi:hypothetical protein
MTIKRFTLLTFSSLSVLILFFSSCSKSNNNSTGAAVTATLGGTAFTPATSLAYYSQSIQTYVVAGYTVKSNDTTALVVSIPTPVTVNTAMTTVNTNVSVQYFLNGSSGKAYIAGGGAPAGLASLTVTSLDTTGHKIVGTFTGTLYASLTDSILVTNGQFNTSYQVTP